MYKKALIVSFVATLVISSGCMMPGEDTLYPENSKSDSDLNNEEMMNETVSDNAARYVSLDEIDLAETAEKGGAALFFHAEWCPTCRTMEANFLAEISDFPDGTTLVKVDYDKETDLRKKYEVTTQSTIVVLDQKGEMLQQLINPSNAELISVLSGT